MATSGTFNFSLPLDELLDAASKRVGGEPLLGEEVRSGLRCLNLLFTDIANRGVLLYTLDQVATTIVSAQVTTTLSAGIGDIYGLVVRENSVDRKIERISFNEWLNIPNKTSAGTPSRYYIHRGRDAPVLYLWQAPANSSTAAVYWRARQVEDAGRLSNDPDAPRRFWPALVSGLAYFLAMERPAQTPRLPLLKMQYEEDLGRALEESRERTTLRLVPYVWGP